MNAANLKKRSLIAALGKRCGTRHWLCAFCAVLIVFQSVLPTAARSAGDTTWVEICGEFGPETILLDMSGDEPVAPEPCFDCDDCAFCVVGNTDAVTPSTSATSDTSRHTEAFVLFREVRLNNPAQFWPGSRGPPWTDIDRSSTAMRFSVDSILSSGDAPWI